jgi:hypothetical protein
VVKGLKQKWHDLIKRRPGRRFEERYEQNREQGAGGARTIKLAAGTLLIAAGIVLLLIPGPGSLLILVGAALLAEESRVVARMLDRGEVAGRKVWSRFSRRWQSLRS